MNYQWVNEVDKIIQSLSKEMNNLETRKAVAIEVVRVLNKHKITARIDCSANVNTPDVVNHAEFRLRVETENITYMFRFIKGRHK